MDSEWLIVTLAAAALFVRVGLGLCASGLSRSKNAAGAILRGIADLCFAALAFWAVGAAILSQTRNSVLGVDPAALFLHDPRGAAAIFLQLVLVLIASGVATGALAERSRFHATWPMSILLAAIIVPVAGRWVWGGWLGRMGFVDVAGASAIHWAGALCALVGVIFVGPRTGKYNRDGSANAIPGHSLPLTLIGVLVLLAAWLPYVLGATLVTEATGASLLPRTALNVVLAAAAGGAVALIYSQLRYGKPEAHLTYSGLLGGLVAITAAGGTIATPAAVVVGAVAGLIVPLASVLLDLLWHIDDPSGGIAIHGVGALWGTLAAGLLTAGDVASRLRLLGVQVLGLLCIAALAVVLSAALFAVLKATVGVRSTEADEYDGLDLAEHDINAYPDFQQTMIKSYHLREA